MRRLEAKASHRFIMHVLFASMFTAVWELFWKQEATLWRQKLGFKEVPQDVPYEMKLRYHRPLNQLLALSPQECHAPCVSGRLRPVRHRSPPASRLYTVPAGSRVRQALHIDRPASQ